MKKSFIKQCLRGFALMALMMATSMVANAEHGMFLRGGYYAEDPNWSTNLVEFKQVGEDLLSAVYTVSSGFEFKLYFKAGEGDEYPGVWIGSTDGGVLNDIPFTFTGVKPTEGGNMTINRDGTYLFTYNTATFELEITGVSRPVIVTPSIAIVGGKVTANKERACEGETVTLTVTPDYGYIANSSNVDIELTIDPGEGRAPRRAPEVGYVFHPESDVVATHDAPATYTFTMPEYPYGVLVNVEFQDIRHSITLRNGLRMTLATDQPDNNYVPEGTEVTVTSTMVPAEDFVANGLIINDKEHGGEADIDITDNGDGTYTFTMPGYDIDIFTQYFARLHGVGFNPVNHWATYYGAYNLLVPQNVTAYIVTGEENNEVQVEQLQRGVIPQNTAVLLYCEQPEEHQELLNNILTLEIPEYEGTYSNNILKGSIEGVPYVTGHVLYEDRFILSEAGTLPGHRCYLPWGDEPSGAPRVLKIKLPDVGGIITGVNDINTSDVVSVKYVNLSGMTSDKPFDGVNVKVITRADGTTETSKIIK